MLLVIPQGWANLGKRGKQRSAAAKRFYKNSGKNRKHNDIIGELKQLSLFIKAVSEMKKFAFVSSVK
jgi:hypothetical protein